MNHYKEATNLVNNISVEKLAEVHSVVTDALSKL